MRMSPSARGSQGPVVLIRLRPGVHRAMGDALILDDQQLGPGQHVRVDVTGWSIKEGSSSILAALNTGGGPVQWTDVTLSSILVSTPGHLYGTMTAAATVSDVKAYVQKTLGGIWDVFSFSVSGVYSTTATAGGPLEQFGITPGSSLDFGQSTATNGLPRAPAGSSISTVAAVALAAVVVGGIWIWNKVS